MKNLFSRCCEDKFLYIYQLGRKKTFLYTNTYSSKFRKTEQKNQKTRGFYKKESNNVHINIVPKYDDPCQILHPIFNCIYNTYMFFHKL